MKKLAGPLVLVLMLVLCIGSWKNILAANGREEAEYESYIEEAEKYEEKKIYIDAIYAYQNAQKIQPDNLDLIYKIAELYKDLGETDNYISSLREAYNKNPQDMETCQILIEASLEEKDYVTAYQDVQQALKQKSCEDDWKDVMEDYLIQLHSVVSRETYLGYDTISTYFYPTDADTAASAVVQLSDAYGVVGKDGSVLLDVIYEDAGFYGSGYFPVCQNGEYFYVDEDVYRRRVPDFPVKWLGSFSESYAPFQMSDTDVSDAEIPDSEKGKYGYLDTEMEAYHVEYAYAGGFSNGRAAVEQEDGTWILINKEFQQVGNETFEEILTDENGYSTQYGVFWGKKDGMYVLYDLNGDPLSTEAYSEVKPFASSEACAVKMKNGLWGFVSIDGTIQLEGTYKDAISYCCGYAPVLLDEGWTLIDTEEHVMLTDTYQTMTQVYADGSFVATLQPDEESDQGLEISLSDATNEEEVTEEVTAVQVHVWMYLYET